MSHGTPASDSSSGFLFFSSLRTVAFVITTIHFEFAPFESVRFASLPSITLDAWFDRPDEVVKIH